MKLLVSLGAAATLTALSIQIAAAGHETRNGGNAVVCRDAEDKVASAELLDLYEAKKRGLKVPQTQKSADAQVRDAVNLLLKHKSSKVRSVGRDIESSLRIAKRDWTRAGELVLVPDSFPRMTKRGCAIEQLASYGDGVLAYNPEIFGALSPTDQAALFLHEAIYKLERIFSGSFTSLRSRKAVGVLLSTVRSDPRKLGDAILSVITPDNLGRATQASPWNRGTHEWMRLRALETFDFLLMNAKLDCAMPNAWLDHVELSVERSLRNGLEWKAGVRSLDPPAPGELRIEGGETRLAISWKSVGGRKIELAISPKSVYSNRAKNELFAASTRVDGASSSEAACIVKRR